MHLRTNTSEAAGFAGLKLAAMASISHSRRLFGTLSDLKVRFQLCLAYPDDHKFEAKSLLFRREALNVGSSDTRKDAVKPRQVPPDPAHRARLQAGRVES